MRLIEWFAAALGAASVWLTVKQRLISWPIGAVMVALYIYIFAEAKLYADMGLQVIYLGLQFYGWYVWANGSSRGARLPVSRIPLSLGLKLVIISLGFAWGLGFFLHRYTDAALPYWDAIITSLSLVAQWLLAKKKIENWPLWIVVDVMAIGVFLVKGLYATSILYLIFCGMACFGYREWRRELV